MASTNHLEQLLQGVDAWNAWRQKESSVDPDLSGANLVGTNLGRANLSRTDLSAAKLMEAISPDELSGPTSPGHLSGLTSSW